MGQRPQTSILAAYFSGKIKNIRVASALPSPAVPEQAADI